VVARDDGKHILICKGAVEEMSVVCTRYTVDGEIGQLDEDHFAVAKEETLALNSDGFRVVAVGYKEMDAPKATYTVTDEAELTLLGYIAFLDPPKENAARYWYHPCANGQTLLSDDRKKWRAHCPDVDAEAIQSKSVTGERWTQDSDPPLTSRMPTMIAPTGLNNIQSPCC
jgi:hypothetical protein